MKTTISRWGNSLAVRIPLPLASQLGLREGSTVNLQASDEGLLLAKPRLDLKALLSTYDSTEPELEWGDPQGREIW